MGRPRPSSYEWASDVKASDRSVQADACQRYSCQPNLPDTVSPSERGYSRALFTTIHPPKYYPCEKSNPGQPPAVCPLGC